jgi:3-oxoacyl-[acyl-carrier protein] reductase
VHGRGSEALSSIRKEIELAGGHSMQASGYVTDFTDIEAARLRIEGEFGPIDIVVANAGGSFTPPAPGRYERTGMASIRRWKPHGDIPYD